MSKTAERRDIEFGGPASYRIVVQGALSEDWSDRLAGLRITVTSRKGGADRTSLVGPLLDQAQLSGVLETLHGPHLPILEVEKLEDENEMNGPADPSDAGPERRS